jgi:hypothetical protein
VLQYLSAIVDAGLVRPVWGTWVIEAEGLRDLALPLDIAGLVLARLDGLEAAGQRVLAVGAVLGAQFDTRLLAQVCGIDSGRAQGIAGAATWRGILQELPTAGCASCTTGFARRCSPSSSRPSGATSTARQPS